MKLNKSLSMLAMGSMLTVLASCGGGGGGGGGSSSYGLYSSPNITATTFVNNLNSVDGVGVYSEIELYADETVRSATPGEEDWFVIWDDKYNEYKAVSLQYIRSIAYYDYYSNNYYETAGEFRSIERDDILSGNLNGDFWGDDYEVVDVVGTDAFGGLIFEGRRSNMLYEDEAGTFDVSLMTAEVENKKAIERAAKISYLYELPIETSLSLVSLGKKVEQKLGSNGGEITAADQLALTNDLEHLTGVTLQEVVAAGTSSQGKEEILEKISSKIGTSAANLEQRLLPDLFGVDL